MSTLIAEGFAAWRECRAAYDELLHAQYQLAEDRTHGSLLNEKGRRAGIDPWRLFTSNATYRNAYASEELQDHWRDHPHQTFASFEAQWPREEDPEPVVAPKVCKHCRQPIIWLERDGISGWAHDRGAYAPLWGCYVPDMRTFATPQED